MIMTHGFRSFDAPMPCYEKITQGIEMFKNVMLENPAIHL